MESLLDTSKTMVDSVLKMGLPNSITKSVKKQKFLNPTIVQSAIFSVFGRKSKLLVESGSMTGKTIGALLYTMATTIKEANGNIILVIVPHKQFKDTILQSIIPIVKGADFRCSDIQPRESYLDQGITRVLVGSVLDVIRAF